jgi:hypothetical protein
VAHGNLSGFSKLVSISRGAPPCSRSAAVHRDPTDDSVYMPSTLVPGKVASRIKQRNGGVQCSIVAWLYDLVLRGTT